MGKNKRLLFLFSILFLSIIGWKIYYRDCERWHGVSVSKDNSKMDGFYIASLIPTENPVIVNDTIKLQIGDAWIEKCWSYNCRDEYEFITGDHGMQYQICLDADPFVLKKTGYYYKWQIGIDVYKYFRFSSKHSLLSFIDSLPASDTLSYPIQMGTAFKPEQPKNIVSKIELVVVDYK